MTQDLRAFDVVVFGATGFTGGLVAEYLATDGPAGLRWAIAGRDAGKLARVAEGLAGTAPAQIVVDAKDEAALRALAARTRVVITTVGPYAQHGEPLVAACVEAGTGYVDLTGEPQFIRRMVDRYHVRAQATGARIVHACGFDSIPSDLGVLVLQTAALARHGRSASRIDNLVGPLRGGASGGTVASMFGMLDEMRRDPEVREVLRDAYSLCDAPRPTGPDRGDPMLPGYDRAHGRLTAPFVMAAVNARIVRRSHQLLGAPWGQGFAYREVMAFPTSAKGARLAAGTTALMGAIAVGATVPPLARWVQGKLPQPGQGPSEAQRARGMFAMELWGHDPAWAAPMHVHVSDDRDPGYGSTRVMIAEAGLGLALDPPISGGGVLTPATALGLPLVERLRRAGLRFDVVA